MIDTSQELFDIFDENNQPLGITKPRDQVHKELKDWHRITGIWILNDKKQLLCQQRSFKKDVYPGMWQLTFGGHLKTGETYEENILSELHEELGLSPNINELISLGFKKNPEHKHHAQLFIYHWNGAIADLRFNDGEVEQVKWVTLQEYQQMIDSGMYTYKIHEELIKYMNR